METGGKSTLTAWLKDACFSILALKRPRGALAPPILSIRCDSSVSHNAFHLSHAANIKPVIAGWKGSVVKHLFYVRSLG